METALIIAPPIPVAALALNSELTKARTQALERAALIGKVTNSDSKILAVRTQQELKGCISAIEKGRKAAKEPLLEAGRRLDTFCAMESKDLDQELGRVSLAVEEFNAAERARVAEEERLQREELARIEREKQAELDRIRREQEALEAEARRVQAEIERKAREEREAIERKAREEREAAEKLAREATNKKQREAAAKAAKEAAEKAAIARAEAVKREAAAAADKAIQDAALEQQRKAASAAAAAIEEKAEDATYCAAKPVEMTRVSGERQTRNWEITSINEHQLYRARPDLATKITFDMRLVKAELDKGNKLPGVLAKEIFTAGVKAAALQKTIEV